MEGYFNRSLEEQIVSERALIERINRKLKPDNVAVRVSRGWRSESAPGRHYELDTNRNEVTNHHFDLETYGRDCGTLAEYERLGRSL